jgi:hypothetical protein
VRRPARVLLTLTAALALTACSAPDPQDQPGPAAAPEIGFGHVHGVDLNPADGVVYAATHYGVFRLGPQGPERIAGRYQDTMGFTISGPDRFLASGHPGSGEPGPAHLGLITSTDRAQTWTTLALRGEADFHALSTAGAATVYGFDSTDGIVMRSDDRGVSWQSGARLDAADLDADPGDPRHVLATTAAGLQESVDGGLTFRAAATQPGRPLVLIDHVGGAVTGEGTALAGIDTEGGVWLRDATGWSRSGELPGAPQAFTAVGADRYLAATRDGVLSSQDAGRTWSVIAATAH